MNNHKAKIILSHAQDHLIQAHIAESAVVDPNRADAFDILAKAKRSVECDTLIKARKSERS